jgi:hypothetical protein
MPDRTNKALEENSFAEKLCKLCKQPRELCKSHVLPDLAYSDVINIQSHPRMIVVRDLAEGRISDKTRQTGFWERLLCKECEKKFSRYETYASNNFLNVTLPAAMPTNPLITFKVDSYRDLKLFLLSLLWRVGVAEGEFFRCVNLGPHEPRLRKMLNEEDPGEPDQYGCLITPLLPEPGVSMEKVITMPTMTRVDDHNGCFFVFRRLAFQYYISRHNIPVGVRQAFLNKNGEMLMLPVRGALFPPLRDLWNRCIRAVRREMKEQKEL